MRSTYKNRSVIKYSFYRLGIILLVFSPVSIFISYFPDLGTIFLAISVLLSIPFIFIFGGPKKETRYHRFHKTLWYCAFLSVGLGANLVSRYSIWALRIGIISAVLGFLCMIIYNMIKVE